MNTQENRFRIGTKRRNQHETVNSRFDQVARILASGSSRRQILAGITGAALVAIGLDRSPVAADTLIVVGDPCGATTCGNGEYCCNASCGICAPLGGFCTQQFCGEPCNQTTCGAGEFCCNHSCSICAQVGGACTTEYCSVGEPCGQSVCGAGEACCNPSCSICAPIGGTCIQVACL